MIKKLKKKIKHFVDVRVKLLQHQQNLNEQTAFDYNQITQLFKEDHFIPFSGWSISPSTILHVLNDISINKKKTIIEFGSGASTFYIAKLLKVLRVDAVLFSVESDEGWTQELEKLLKLYGLKEYVTIIYAPLSEVPEPISHREQQLWYDTNILENSLKNISNIDLVLVDGPIGRSSPYARFSAIPFLKEKLSESCSIYLDDVERPQENTIALEWKKILKMDITIRENYAVLNKATGFDVSPYKLKTTNY